MSPFIYKWLKFSLLALVAGGFVALAIYALVMRDEIRSAQLEPPLIEAPTQALKTRPEAPGGLEFPNQDKLVFDLLENTAPGGGVPGAGLTVSPTAPSQAAAASSFVTPTVPVAASPSAQPVAEEIVAAPAAPVAVAEAKPAETKPELKPEPKAETKSTPAKGGSWGVQLAAVGSNADGQTVAKQLQGKFVALQGLSPRVVPAPGGSRYRVQFMGLPTRAAAQAVCDKLGSQPCFPIGK